VRLLEGLVRLFAHSSLVLKGRLELVLVRSRLHTIQREVINSPVKVWIDILPGLHGFLSEMF
jgi:hypothetical protein